MPLSCEKKKPHRISEGKPMDSGIRLPAFISISTLNFPTVIPWVSFLSVLCVPSENHKADMNVTCVNCNSSAWYLVFSIHLSVY